MKVQDFILGVTGILSLITVAMVVMLNGDMRSIQTGYSPLAQKIQKDSIAIASLKGSQDSLRIADKAIVKSIVYLDSCNQIKVSKADRAEKRGRFIGGLLKGLFPGL